MDVVAVVGGSIAAAVPIVGGFAYVARNIARDVVTKWTETTTKLGAEIKSLSESVTGLRSDAKERDETQRKHGEEIAVLKDRLDTRRARPRRGR